MSALYENADWSRESLSGLIAKALVGTSGDKMSAYSLSRLSYYTEELNRMRDDGLIVSLTDFWGLLVEFFVYRQVGFFLAVKAVKIFKCCTSLNVYLKMSCLIF